VPGRSHELSDRTQVDRAPAGVAERWAIRGRLLKAGVWHDVLLRRMLAVADVAAAVTAMVALAVFGDIGLATLFWLLASMPFWIVVAKLDGLYDRDQRSLRHMTVDEAPHLLLWAVTSALVVALLLHLLPVPALETGEAARLAGVAAVAAFVLRASMRWLWRRITPPERVVILGAGAEARAARRKIALFEDMHLDVVDEREEPSLEELDGPPEWLLSADRVVVASSGVDERLVRLLLTIGREHQIKVSVVPPAHGVYGTAVGLDRVADLPVVEYNTWDVPRSTMLLKRCIDLAVGSIALVVFSPVLAIAAIAIKLDSRGPVLFRQVRAGYQGRPFRVVKFRTMVADAEARLPDLVDIASLDEPVFKLPRDPRVTRVGRVLRRWSIDELPQLVNVLRGEMSLVGPRPEQLDLVERYTPEQRLRLDLKPGMTGPMQVYGRGGLSFDERLAVERDYIENLSLRRDVRLLAMTLGSVISGRGSY
jgi:exopolysaccharide biosynthesis polyprenyl glycosylphosphotransferase